MPIHNFVDNIVNSATLFVNSAAPSSSKVYLSSFSFLLFEKETLHTSLVSNSFISYNPAKNSLLVNFVSNINQVILASTSIFVGPSVYESLNQYVYKTSTTYLNTSFEKFPANIAEGNASKSINDNASIFVKNDQDQNLTWFVSTNLLKHFEVEIPDTPDDNGNQQPSIGLKEFWA